MRLTRFIGGATLALAGTVLLGWLADVPSLTRLSGDDPMRVTTAGGFVLCGGALVGLGRARVPVYARVLGGGVALVGGLTLLEIFFDVVPGLAGAWARMAVTTAVALATIGLALIYLDRRPVLSQALTVVTASLGILGIVDHAYAFTLPRTATSYRSMSAGSALLCVLVAIGLFSARRDRALVALVTSAEPTGALTRRLLPVAVGIPLVIGWLRLEGERLGYYDARFGTAVFATVTTLLFAAAVLGSGKLARDAERLRRGLESEMHRANRFLDAVVENIPDMVFVKDAERLAFQRFNRAGEELLGHKREELLGKNDHDFFPPDEAAFFQAKDRETLAGRKLVDIPEEPIDTAGGKRWLHTKKVPILDDDGRPAYLLGISRDITLDKQVNDDLRRAKNQAEAAGRELEAFSYSVSHDLRAPLRAIDGFSAALIEDCGPLLDETGKQHLGRVRAAAQRMAELIDDLLELARVSRTELRRETVDLAPMAREIFAELMARAPEREIELVAPAELVTSADPRLMSVVLANLLENAWKFTSKNPRARVELGAIAGEPTRYFVRDDGAGFDPAYAGKLFGAFQRLHHARDFDGTGIGLATVQRVVHRHGGAISAESQVGRGATFTFTLAASGPRPG